jgi:N-acetylmuramoyl-L-alanine amidase
MILKKGSRGSQVRELQELLGLKVDGIFGPGTEKVVIEFQQKNGLKSDGVVGPKTWESLLKNKVVKVVPVYKTSSKSEDFDDPEDEMPVDTSLKEDLPTCKNTIELINLINSSKITRKISRLVFHCTATQQSATVTSIQKYWKENLKWKSPGYHIIVRPDGSWTQLSDFNNPTNGVAGINSTALHVSYIGGVDSKGNAVDNRTDDQSRIFEAIYHTFKNKMPNLTFHGHYEFSKKACPCYNVENWIKAIQE